MIYSKYDLERTIRNMIQNAIFEDSIYMDTFNYTLDMYTNWAYYETLDYPILIMASGIPIEEIKHIVGDSEENIIELNKEKNLFLYVKKQNGKITKKTKWFITIEEQRYTNEDFKEKLTKYLEEQKVEETENENIAEAIEEERKETAKKDKEETERRIRSLETEIESYETMINSNKRQLEREERKLESLKKETDIKNKIKKDIKDIKEHELVKSVIYKPMRGVLVIKTKTIYMQHPTDKNDRRLLGKMKIELDVNKYTVRLFNDTETRKGYWGDDCHHPHVSDCGDPCLGNSAEMLAECKLNNDLYIAFLTVLGFLQQFDIEDVAGRYYVCWDRVDENGNVIEKGQEEVYDNYCSICGVELCEEDQYYCEECGTYTCEEHNYYVDGTSMCENCYNKYVDKCSRCDNEHNKDNMYFVDEQWVCANCYEEDVRTCAKCGEEHIIDNMVEDVETGDWYCTECWDERQKGENEDV